MYIDILKINDKNINAYKQLTWQLTVPNVIESVRERRTINEETNEGTSEESQDRNESNQK